MQRKTLGHSGLSVSPLCLGAMMFGGEAEEREAKRIVDAAFDGGVNFIDTADVYHRGVSEEVTGRLVADKRADWVLATKVGSPFRPGDPNRGGLSRRWNRAGAGRKPRAPRNRLDRRLLLAPRGPEYGA